MRIENNVLIGDENNMISPDESADNYDYVTSFEGNFYLKKINLLVSKALTKYDELLLCLCRKSDETILDTLFITRYAVCEMFKNYEFSDGAWKLNRVMGSHTYNVELSIYDNRILYATCNNISKGYLFGRKKEEE